MPHGVRVCRLWGLAPGCKTFSYDNGVMTLSSLSRRSLLAFTASAAFAKFKKMPVGLELYSVRDELTRDLTGAVRSVAKMGYDGVEFYAPYMDWTPDYARQVRKLLDALKIRCFSNHTRPTGFTPERLPRIIELNQILGSKYIVMSSAGKVDGIDGWKSVADTLNRASAEMKSAGLRAGFHNHKAEFVPINGTRPMEVLARHTDKSVVLQLDIGTCLDAGVNPVDWINQNPGRIVSMHLKDWSPKPELEYKALFGEGAADWKAIFTAAEKSGGIEYYLIEQEGSRLTPFQTAEHCLKTFRKMRA